MMIHVGKSSISYMTVIDEDKDYVNEIITYKECVLEEGLKYLGSKP
jgi:hypothetical protein